MRAFFESHAHDLDEIRDFPFHDRDAYARFLAQTRHYVVHTTRLLGLTASRVGEEREKLHFRFLKHAAEERSHHLLAERDLRELDQDIGEFPELPITSALYESQYYRVEFRDPTIIFGYILALEGLAVIHGDWVYETVCKNHGHEAAAFVKLHAHEDPEHVERTLEVVEGLTSAEQALIQTNFSHTCSLYRLFLAAIRPGTST